jgi:hypothetical protein
MTSEDMPERPSRARTLLVTAIKIVVSLGLLAVLFSRVDVSRLWGITRQASVAWESCSARST